MNIPLNRDPEDSTPRVPETTYTVDDLKSDDPLRRSAAYRQFLKPQDASDAWDRLNCAYEYLRRQACRGDKEALRIIYLKTKEMVTFLRGPHLEVSCSEQMADNWESLMNEAEDWPLLLSADQKTQKKEVEEFNEWPLAKNTLFKIDQGGRGRRTDNSPDSPTAVARLLVCRIEGMRKTLKTSSTFDFDDLQLASQITNMDVLLRIMRPKEDFHEQRKTVRSNQRMLEAERTKLAFSNIGRDSMPTNRSWASYYETTPEVISSIRSLPQFSNESQVSWLVTINGFIESNDTIRKKHIPFSWDEQALSQAAKGKGANYREKLKSAFKSIAPPRE